MCGDGANDCGALKAAHAGISLSEAEASVASPFTSSEANISCVPRVIREGRAALVTSFGVFKFMVLYSLMEFMSTIILYSIDSNLTDFQFLFIDLCLVVNLAFFFGRNKAYSGPLSQQVPLTSLLSLTPLLSLLLQFTIMVIFQLLSFHFIHLYSWFVPFHFVNADYYISYENYAVYSISQFQYIIMALVFSQGAPFREPVYTNKIFFSSMCLMTCVCIYVTLAPAEWVVSLLQLRFPPNLDFPYLVLALAVWNIIISMFVESFVIQFLLLKKLRYSRRNLTKSRCKYLAIAKELDEDRCWPPSPIFLEAPHTCNQQNEIKGNVNHAFEGDTLNTLNYNTKL